MAFTNFLKTVDQAWHDIFHTKAVDPRVKRNELIATVQENTKLRGSKVDKPWLSIQNGGFEIVLPFEINGANTFYGDADGVNATRKGLISDIRAGAADAYLGLKTAATGKKEPVRKRASPNLSPEARKARGAKAAATRAANKAKAAK